MTRVRLPILIALATATTSAAKARTPSIPHEQATVGIGASVSSRTPPSGSRTSHIRPISSPSPSAPQYRLGAKQFPVRHRDKDLPEPRGVMFRFWPIHRVISNHRNGWPTVRRARSARQKISLLQNSPNVSCSEGRSSGIVRLTQVTFMKCFTPMFSLVMLPPQVPHPRLEV